MKNTVKGISVVLVILLLSVAIGFGAQTLRNTLDAKAYPREYTEFVTKYAAEYRIPETILYAVIKCESGFDSTAKSSAGAIGLMQLMPDTFAYLCTRTGDNYETGMLYDPETNIRYGAYYLSMLYDRFGVWETAFAAYNGGPSRVQSWIDEGKVDESGHLTEIPLSETATYVERVRTATQKYENLYYTTEGVN